MKNPVVYCYAEGRGEQWEAVCVNFDLAVQGRSFPEVFGRLGEAIKDYLLYVHSLPEAEQARFLSRRVPFWTRLEFAARAFFDAIRSRDGGSNHRHSYTSPCPA